MASGLPTKCYYVTFTLGQTYTIPDDCETLHISPSTALALGTLKMPANPNVDQVYSFVFHQVITALTTQVNTGQGSFIGNVPLLIAAHVVYSYRYASDKNWYAEF